MHLQELNEQAICDMVGGFFFKALRDAAKNFLKNGSIFHMIFTDLVFIQATWLMQTVKNLSMQKSLTQVDCQIGLKSAYSKLNSLAA